jgi:hypothetical protein
VPQAPRTFAFVITGHGYGHASRQMEVMRTLLARDPEAEVRVLSAAPEAIFRSYLGAEPGIFERVAIVPHRADVGLVQIDSLRMDPEATLGALDERFGAEQRAVDELCDRLAGLRASVIVADIPPSAFAAAARLRLPSVGVSNFDWAWIYGYYAQSDPRFGRWEQLFLRWQAQATLALHLEPGPALSGFPRVIEVAPLARSLPRAMARDGAEIRRSLDIPAGHRAVLVSFGGCGLEDAERRIPKVPGVVWLLAPPMPDLGRPDTRFLPELPYLALFALADAVFIKPGYGTVCEAGLHRSRVLYTDRGDFPEYDYLVAWMEANLPAVHVPSSLLGTEEGALAIEAALGRLFALPERWPGPMNGAEEVAAIVEAVAESGC